MTGPVQDVATMGLALQRFAWPDYLVFVAMLVLCAVIGVYFGYFAPGQHDEDEYLMGGRKMQVLPISLSLVASYISGITLLGLPTEVYVFGVQPFYAFGGMLMWLAVFNWAVLPIFHDLQLMTLYQYLQMRFDRRVRLFGSVFFTISLLTWLPIVIYVPALAFNQVTGINVHIVTPAVCIVCVFYTCVGGMKAVVWTDVVQTVSMLLCIFLVAIRGTFNVGGASVVFQRNLESGRIEPPDFRLDPFVRLTFWGYTLGHFFSQNVSCGLSQAMMQRYLALPDIGKARRAAAFFVLGCLLLFAVCTYCGLLIFASYHDCDPVTTKLARAKDQVLPLLVMDTLGMYPGLPGLFVAGVFSAALSSLSTGLNSMAAVVVEDFWRPLSRTPPSEASVNMVMRLVVVVFGVVCVGLVFVVERLGVVLQLSGSLNSISAGPVLAVFVGGAFMPWVNATGCLAGAGAGLSFMAWLVLSAQHAIARGDLLFPEKPVSVQGCTYSFNATTPHAVHEPQLPMWLFRVSYHWYPVIGVVVSLVVATAVSLLCRSEAAVDRRLFSPAIRRFLHPPPKAATDFAKGIKESTL
ncbi:sodium-coupled monocarboxylate transporter 1-like [Thrips palmi]|uniref:Sodium-coupled monocarboxylate transporter 1-like n=1 Tax=Thrips palmi TaxID=161013 RepID=A0A6P8ZDK8_THRPL|nr:sodium-coupled monocarboxylate transporter 1-like [Thrips palmi]